MSLYKAVGSAAVAARTMLTIISTATIRPRLVAAVYSNIGSIVLDSNWEVTGRRFTAAGTTSAVTPAGTDSSDPASTFTAGSNATVEPTYTANTTFTDMGINPRSTFRWVAYDPRDEIIMPATAANAVLAQVEATVLQ
jgi:hypothetical protein